jgi:hypothetical protein
MKTRVLQFITVFAFITFVTAIAPTVSAHVLKSDGTIGAILHVSPDDDPIAGVPTDFFFELKDTENKFRPENCDCIARIIQDGKVTSSQPLFASNPSPSLEDASFTYTLPEKGVYQVQLLGAPKNDNAFERFELSWDIRVDREGNPTKQTNTHWISELMPYLLGIGLFIVLLISIQKKGGAKKK